jgi:hypothetical protein
VELAAGAEFAEVAVEVAVAGFGAVRRPRLGGGGGGGVAPAAEPLAEPPAFFAGAFGGAVVGGAGRAAAGAPGAVAPAPATAPLAVTPINVLGAFASAKKSRQIGSTLSGSARNCWYFSSTNQSLGPNSGAADDTVDVRLF